MSIPAAGDLRVWWIPQVPMTPFHAAVSSPTEGAHVLDILARYDAFQFENNVKPDYCNAGGLETFDGDEWVDWESEDNLNIDEWAAENLQVPA